MSALRILLPLLVSFLPLQLPAQVAAPDLPCCIDFSSDRDWISVTGQAVEGLGLATPGPSGQDDDFYLTAQDDSGASWVYLQDPGDGLPTCLGDWRSLLSPQRCLELCWDVRLLTDGDNNQVIAKPARISIFSGNLQATFQTSLEITEGGGPNGGWYSFCAPIALADDEGNLPSSDQGQWIMNDSNGNPAPPANWDTLIGNIERIGFFVDYHSFQTEEWCWDNICLQERPCSSSLPCCIDFNVEQLEKLDSTAVIGQNVRGLGVGFPGPSGEGDDGYLTAQDAINASYVYLQDPGDDNPGKCFGPWKDLLSPGRCLELCWDVNLISDGDDNQVIAKPAQINIYSGNLWATFRTSVNIVENGGPNNGWYSFCAPIAMSDSNGNLPSDERGSWTMSDTDGNPVPSEAWDQLLCNVDRIGFFVDYHGESQTEEWCWDNICLQERPCPKPCEISNGKWDKREGPDGERILTYSFDITNNTQYSATHGIPSVSGNLDILSGPDLFNPALGPGETRRVTLSFGPMQPGGEICFDYILYNPALSDEGNQEGECCRVEICLKVPCVCITNESIQCVTLDGPGGFIMNAVQYELNLINISGRTLQNAYLLSSDPSVTITPSLIPLGGLPDGAGQSIGPFNIMGYTPGEELCLHLVFLDGENRECCFQEVCIEIPDCPPSSQLLSPANGLPTEPCDLPVDPETGETTAPHDCFDICDSELISNADNPGTPPGSYTWTFTIQNNTPFVMDHLLIPDPNISPSSVSFPVPLAPGEAARVEVILASLPTAGVWTVPLVLVSTSGCECCSRGIPIQLPIRCIEIIEDGLVCVGLNADGKVCYEYSVQVRNPADEVQVLDGLYFLSPNPNIQGLEFSPYQHDLNGLAAGDTTNISTTICVNPGETSITFFLSVHNDNFEECCAVKRILRLPDCPGVAPGTFPSIESTLQLNLDPDFKNNMILRFAAPANLKCEVQTSTTLRPEDWVTIHTVFGTGQNTQVRHPFNPRESPKRFYRLLYHKR